MAFLPFQLSPVSLLLVLVLVYLVQRVIFELTTGARRRRIIRENGCKPAWAWPQKDPLGVEMMYTMIRSAKEHKFLEESRERFLGSGHNSFFTSILCRPAISTCEPEIIKTVLSTKFQSFELGRRRQMLFQPFLGPGIFNSDGAAWEHSRALIRPNFTRAQVADLDTFEIHVAELIKVVPKDGSTIDLQNLFFRLTVDSATEFLFGKSSNSLQNNDLSDFVEGYEFGVEYMVRVARSGMILNFFPSKKWRKARAAVWKFADQIIHDAIESQKSRDLEKSEYEGRYVFLHELLKQTSDPYVLRSETLNVLLAGRDTTASLLSNTWHYLARRPDIWSKLKTEVDKLHGNKPTYEEIKDMKYLRWVLNESLRLMPVVPSNTRVAIEDVVLPIGGGEDGRSPLFLPKGWAIHYSPYSMHRRPDIYGSDCDEFRPERWETLRLAWEYLPFNGGPRICVGQQYALTEASYTTIRLMQAFPNIEPRDNRPWCELLTLTMASGVGCKVSFPPS